MAIRSWIRRQFKNGVIVTDFVPSGFNSVVLSFTAHDGTSFPDGSIGPFIITADQGLATEEKILVASRSGSVFTIDPSGRGYNGTSAQNHGANATILHSIDAQDFDEANQVAVQTLGAIAAKGDVLIGSSPNTLTRLPIGSTAQTPQVVAGTLAYVGFGVGNSQTVGSANSDGTNTTYARDNHVHAGVASWNGRNGAVFPVSGDYTASQVTNAADKNSGVQQAFIAEVQAPDLAVTGLTGAVNTARFVGATSSGAPSSGSFNAGDWVIDLQGRMWICTVGGSPGTWVCPAYGLPQGATVATAQNAASTAYGDLATSGPAVTVTTGTKAIVAVSANIGNGTTADGGMMSVALSGATTAAAVDANGVGNAGFQPAGGLLQTGFTSIITGLTPGSNIFTAKYRTVTGGTCTFSNRNIVVTPLP